jgi:hypothetical protein
MSKFKNFKLFCPSVGVLFFEILPVCLPARQGSDLSRLGVKKFHVFKKN